MFEVCFVLLQIVTRIHKACLKYDQWKSQHNPQFKPWLNPEQMYETVAQIDWADVGEAAAKTASAVEQVEEAEEVQDESQIKESEIVDEYTDDGPDD